MPANNAADRSYHHGNLRDATLAVGLELLAERSEDALSLREIARVVGVTPSAVYRHFPDKAALLRALALEGSEDLAETQRRAKIAVGGGGAGLLAMGEAYVEFAVRNPALFRLMFSHPPQHDPMDMNWGGMSAAMAQLLEASGQLAASTEEARSLALHCWAIVHGLSMLVLDGQIPNDPGAIRAALETCRPFDAAHRAAAHG